MAESSFSISEAVSFGWKTATSNLVFFLVLMLIMFGISVGFSLLIGIFQDGPAIFVIVLQLVSFVVNLIITLGMIKIALAFVDGEKPDYKILFSTTPYMVKYFLASILYGLIVMVGLLLFVIPGIIWAIKYSQIVYLVVDKGYGPIQALKASGKLTKGNRWNYLLFAFVMVGIELLGLLALVVGLLVAIPVVMLAAAFVYRQMESKAQNLDAAIA